MKFAVVVFPGTNCDRDCYHAFGQVLGQLVEYLWHEDTHLGGYDCLVLPGGFSYGDYLRAGAIARFSPVMAAITGYARNGGLVIGICNGFQILAEAGLLPGALMRNHCLEFRCRWVHVRVENASTPFTHLCHQGQVLRLPIAHGEGCYYADQLTLERLKKNGQVVLRYCTADGRIAPEANPNGSLENIAGVCNEAGNVFALMPHPERCCEGELGSTDGRWIFGSIVKSLEERGKRSA